MDYYSSLKQQSAGRHVARLGHSILILNLYSYSLKLHAYISREATHTNFVHPRYLGCIRGHPSFQAFFDYRRGDLIRRGLQ